jgi:hypothetical protein
LQSATCAGYVGISRPLRFRRERNRYDAGVGGSPYAQGMRGDRVEIVVDAGNEVRTYDIVATRNGRRVEVSTSRGVVEVTEVTRSGTPVRTGRFMSNRVLALVEHPAEPRPTTET